MHESIGVCLIFFCSFSVTASSRAAAASRLLSVWTGCLIRTKLCWHLIFFSPNIHPCPPLGCQVKARTPHNVCMRCKTNIVPGKLCYACPQQSFRGLFFLFHRLWSVLEICRQGGQGSFQKFTCLTPMSKNKKEKETTKTNVAVHHFPSGCRIQPDQTWHNKHLYLQELYSSFLHLSVQISLSICLKTPVTTGTNMKICSLSLNLFFLYQ